MAARAHTRAEDTFKDFVQPLAVDISVQLCSAVYMSQIVLRISITYFLKTYLGGCCRWLTAFSLKLCTDSGRRRVVGDNCICFLASLALPDLEG